MVAIVTQAEDARSSAPASVFAHSQRQNIKVDLHMWLAISIVSRHPFSTLRRRALRKVSSYSMGYFRWNQVNFVFSFIFVSSFDLKEKWESNFTCSFDINSICYATWKDRLDEEEGEDNANNNNIAH